jgi:hypothetical protein
MFYEIWRKLSIFHVFILKKQQIFLFRVKQIWLEENAAYRPKS